MEIMQDSLSIYLLHTVDTTNRNFNQVCPIMYMYMDINIIIIRFITIVIIIRGTNHLQKLYTGTARMLKMNLGKNLYLAFYGLMVKEHEDNKD